MKYGIIELHDNYDFSTPIAPREVVMCGECKKYNTDGYRKGCGFCLYHHSVMEDSDFCSCGERNEQ